MKGISPPAPLYRRLKKKELPIEKTGKIQQIWIFSAPRERNWMSIGQLRERPAAFYAVIRKGTPQRPTPRPPITDYILAEYADRNRR